MDNSDQLENLKNKNQSVATRLWIYSMELERNELTEKDFYPPEDNRVIHSGLDDIENGDNFNDYIAEYWSLCKEEDMEDLY